MSAPVNTNKVAELPQKTLEREADAELTQAIFRREMDAKERNIALKREQVRYYDELSDLGLKTLRVALALAILCFIYFWLAYGHAIITPLLQAPQCAAAPDACVPDLSPRVIALVSIFALVALVAFGIAAKLLIGVGDKKKAPDEESDDIALARMVRALIKAFRGAPAGSR